MRWVWHRKWSFHFVGIMDLAAAWRESTQEADRHALFLAKKGGHMTRWPECFLLTTKQREVPGAASRSVSPDLSELSRTAASLELSNFGRKLRPRAVVHSGAKHGKRSSARGVCSAMWEVGGAI